jgi:hypothetical protein
MVQSALKVLADAPQFALLGENGKRFIEERYSLEKCLPQMLGLYQSVLAR